MRATVTSAGATAARTPRRASSRWGPPVTTSTSRGGASTVMMRPEPSLALAGYVVSSLPAVGSGLAPQAAAASAQSTRATTRAA